MPNQPHPDKIHLGLRIPRALHLRLKKIAQRYNETVTGLVLQILHKEADKVVLTPEDYEEIAKQARELQRKNRSKRNGSN